MQIFYGAIWLLFNFPYGYLCGTKTGYIMCHIGGYVLVSSCDSCFSGHDQHIQAIWSAVDYVQEEIELRQVHTLSLRVMINKLEIIL